jgi:hypothetical protein
VKKGRAIGDFGDGGSGEYVRAIEDWSIDGSGEDVRADTAIEKKGDSNWASAYLSTRMFSIR